VLQLVASLPFLKLIDDAYFPAERIDVV